MFSAIKKFFRFIFNDKTQSIPKKLLLASLVNFAFIFSVLVFIPYETFFGNIAEFTFTFSEFWWPVAVFGIILFLAMLLVEMIFKGKLFNIVVSLVFGATAACYVQSMFLNGMMKTLDGSADSWTTSQKMLNLVVWLIVAIFPTVILIFSKKIWSTVCKLGSVLIAGMQIVALLTMLLTTPQISFDNRITTDGLYEVSKKDNVIIFVLDRFDQVHADTIINDYPDFFDKLEGFTYYPNTSGSYIFTHNTMPFMLTGIEMADFYPTDQMKADAIRNSKYLEFIRKNVDHIGLYTSDTVLDTTAAAETNYADNVKPLPTTSDKKVFVKASIKASLYRVAPFIFKTRFSYTSDNFNFAVSAADESALFKNGSHYYDAVMFEHLKTSGLQLNNKYDASFKIIHTMGAHYPYELTENAEYTEIETTQINSALGEFKILYKYFEELKRLGVYDNSTIIITSDHGDTCINNKEDRTPHKCPIMFFKPSGNKAGMPFNTSLAPTSHMDIFPTVIKALGGNTDNLSQYNLSFEGIPLDELTEDTQRTRYFYIGLQDPEIVDRQSAISVEMSTQGDARNLSNWKETGRRVYTTNTNHGF